MNNFLLHNLRPSYCPRDKTTAITFSVVFHLGPLQRGVRSYQNVVNIATKTICLAYRPSHSERTARLVYCIVCVCVCVCDGSLPSNITKINWDSYLPINA